MEESYIELIALGENIMFGKKDQKGDTTEKTIKKGLLGGLGGNAVGTGVGLARHNNLGKLENYFMEL